MNTFMVMQAFCCIMALWAVGAREARAAYSLEKLRRVPVVQNGSRSKLIKWPRPPVVPFPYLTAGVSLIHEGVSATYDMTREVLFASQQKNEQGPESWLSPLLPAKALQALRTFNKPIKGLLFLGTLSKVYENREWLAYAPKALIAVLVLRELKSFIERTRSPLKPQQAEEISKKEQDIREINQALDERS